MKLAKVLMAKSLKQGTGMLFLLSACFFLHVEYFQQTFIIQLKNFFEEFKAEF